jgi:hypothetical protein
MPAQGSVAGATWAYGVAAQASQQDAPASGNGEVLRRAYIEAQGIELYATPYFPPSVVTIAVIVKQHAK